jgi:hypothetical protein
MDTLKQYLQAHRQEMDVEIPPADLLPHIQAGAVAPAAKAVLIKYLIGFGILAIIGTGAWWMIQQQKAVQLPAPSTPPNDVMQQDTVPVQKDTMPAQPVIQPRKKKLPQTPPAPPVIHKHKKSVDTVHHEPQPRIKKNIDTIVHQPQPRIKKNVDTTVHSPQPRIKKPINTIDRPSPPRIKKNVIPPNPPTQSRLKKKTLPPIT